MDSEGFWTAKRYMPLILNTSTIVQNYSCFEIAYLFKY